MSVDKYTKEELKEMSLIDVAYEIMNGGKTPYAFNELMNEVAKLVGLSEEEVNEKIAQFYTDVNIDGRFLSLGDNRWGLRLWYPVDKSEEDVVTVTKPKKKKAKKAADSDASKAKKSAKAKSEADGEAKAKKAPAKKTAAKKEEPKAE